MFRGTIVFLYIHKIQILFLYYKDNNNMDREKLESIADKLEIDFTNKNYEQLRNAIDAKINKKQT